MKLLNRYGLPLPVFNAVRHTVETYERPGAKEALRERAMSASTLVNPPRLTMLRAIHDAAIQADAAHLLTMVTGIAFHYMMVATSEEAGEDGLREQSVTEESGGWQLAGRFDVLGDHVVCDWKWTNVWSLLSARFEWEALPNVYAWLARRRGLRIDEARTWVLLRDWSPERASRDPRLPPIPFAEVRRKPWEPQVADEYVAGRIAAYEEAVATVRVSGDPNSVPVCTAQERWEGREGSIRCRQYCDVARFCSYAKGLAADA